MPDRSRNINLIKKSLNRRISKYHWIRISTKKKLVMLVVVLGKSDGLRSWRTIWRQDNIHIHFKAKIIPYFLFYYCWFFGYRLVCSHNTGLLLLLLLLLLLTMNFITDETRKIYRDSCGEMEKFYMDQNPLWNENWNFNKMKIKKEKIKRNYLNIKVTRPPKSCRSFLASIPPSPPPPRRPRTNFAPNLILSFSFSKVKQTKIVAMMTTV